MKVRILGCGTSTGVPRIGNDWGQCDPAEPRNSRLRSSILVESGGQRMLVDCGPDLRQQLLDAEIGRLDGVIVTHAHGDHCHGIDELRPVSQAIGGPVPLHARAAVLDELRLRFAYVFEQSEFYRPIGEAREIGDDLEFGQARVRAIDQPHGNLTSLGLRFDEGQRSIVYAIDFSDLTDDMAALYQGVDVGLYLVHMGNGLDYRTLVAELPDWAAPAYDGLEIE